MSGVGPLKCKSHFRKLADHRKWGRLGTMPNRQARDFYSENTTRSVTLTKSRRAFTVVELMVVVGVISILAALVFPALSKSKLSARATGCLQNLRQIGLAVQLCADENDAHYPV